MDNNEKEIDVIDMLLDVCMHWRGILVVGVIGLLLSMAYSIYRFSDSTTLVESEIIKEPSIKLTDDEQEMLELYHMYDYLYKKQVLTNNNDELLKIDFKNMYYTYVEYIISGNPDADVISKLLVEKINLSRNLASGLDRFISAECLYSQRNDLVDDSKNIVDEDSKCILKITLLGEDEEYCKNRAEKIKLYLESVKAEIISSCGEFDMTLVIDDTNVHDGLTLENYITTQRDAEWNKFYAKNNIYNSINDNVKKYIDEESRFLESEKTDNSQYNSASIKYNFNKKILLVGILGGFIISIVFFVLRYILNRRLRFEDDIERIFDIAVLGHIINKKRKKGIDGLLMKIRQRNINVLDKNAAIDMIAANILAFNGKKESIYITGCDMKDDTIEVAKEIKNIIEKSDIKVDIGKSIIKNAEAVDEMIKSDVIVFIEKAGESEYHNIENEIQKCALCDMKINGIVVVE